LHINGKPAQNPKFIQFTYQVTFPGTINTSQFDDWGISQEDQRAQGPGYMILVLNEEQKQKIQGLDPNIKIEPYDVSKATPNPHNLFPYDREHYPNFTVDNYGPVYIPQAGQTVALSMENLAMFRRAIEVYEGNRVEVEKGVIKINGQPASSYTFRMNYYWMMGDNRHNSEDSRVWGFVPEDHVVGKPLFIWLSTKNGSMANGIRWERLFRSASKD
jgi:signal peptidase I